MLEGWLAMRCVLTSEVGRRTESVWVHVSHCYFSPQFRPTCPRLRAAGHVDGGGHAVLEPDLAVGGR
eukprot:494305-Lingulodinium_polyedra.AAC.1